MRSLRDSRISYSDLFLRVCLRFRVAGLYCVYSCLLDCVFHVRRMRTIRNSLYIFETPDLGMKASAFWPERGSHHTPGSVLRVRDSTDFDC